MFALFSPFPIAIPLVLVMQPTIPFGAPDIDQHLEIRTNDRGAVELAMRRGR